jgi:hypothetical protein
MPDEATPAPEPETQDTPPADGAVPETTPPAESPEDSTPTVDYQQRYESLVPEYTRGQQMLAALRGDHGPEVQAQAFDQIGVEVEAAEQEEEGEEWSDPEERINQLEQKIAEREEAEEFDRRTRQEEAYIGETLDALESKANVKLTDKQVRLVVNDALANREEDGRPNLEGSMDDLLGIKSEAAEEYRASKKASVPPAGSVGEEKIDFRDPDARRKFMADDFAARQAAGES